MPLALDIGRQATHPSEGLRRGNTLGAFPSSSDKPESRFDVVSTTATSTIDASYELEDCFVKVRFSLILSVLLGLLIPNAAHALGRLSPEAKAHFDAGISYVDEPTGPKWEEALQEFKAAYAISPAWELKNNIALCALNLERDGEAIAAYQEYLAHGGEKGLSDKHRRQIERDIATLTASLVRVNLHIDASEGVIVDERRSAKGELRVNRYAFKGGQASLGIHPGSHKLSVESQGRVSETWSFDAPPASTHEHHFAVIPEAKSNKALVEQSSNVDVIAPSEPTKAERVPTAVWIGLAATGVFTVAATTTGVLALSKNKDYDRSSDPDERRAIKDSGERFVLLTNLGIGAAIVSASATAYFYLNGSRTASSRSNPDVLRMAPLVTRGFAGASVAGKF